MNRCWVLLVTRGLRVWLPPEVYLSQDLAIRESVRWRATFRMPSEPRRLSLNTRTVHLTETRFPESWRACPVWVGTSWSERTYPRMRIELMAADENEAAGWVRRRTPKGASVCAGCNAQFARRGVFTNVGVFRVKRVMGF